MKIKNYIRTSFILISIGSVSFSCSNGEAKEENKIPKQVENISNEIVKLTPDQEQNLSISLSSITEQIMDKTIKLNGKMMVSPNFVHSISSLYGGHIKNILAMPGMTFKKGQILATLEDPQFIQLQEDYLSNIALLQAAELNYQRQLELNKNKVTSDKIFEAAALEYRKLTISNKSLSEKIKLIGINPNTLQVDQIKSQINIIAPFNGRVSGVLVNKGQYISPTDKLFELLDPNGLLANFKVFESDLTHVQVGQQIKISTNASPNKQYEAKVITINPQVAEDGSTDIFASIQGLDSELISGLFINGMMSIQKQPTQVLPTDCIVSYENKEYVWEQLVKGQFKLIPVKTGTQYNNFTEITSVDLRGKSFVEKGAYDLLMALKNKAEE